MLAPPDMGIDGPVCTVSVAEYFDRLRPLIAQMTKARFPEARLVMTDKPFSATAMGAAIQSAEHLTLHDILSRHFGVVRLADHGTREYFASIFRAGTRLPRRGSKPLERTVQYVPRHNI